MSSTFDHKVKAEVKIFLNTLIKKDKIKEKLSYMLVNLGLDLVIACLCILSFKISAQYLTELPFEGGSAFEGGKYIGC